MPDFIAPGDPWGPDQVDDGVMEEELLEDEEWPEDEEDIPPVVILDEDETQADAERARGRYAIRNVLDYNYEAARLKACLEHAICYLTRERQTLGNDYQRAQQATGGNAMIRVAIFSTGPTVEGGMRRGSVLSEGIHMDREEYENDGYALEEIEGNFIGPDRPGNYHAAEDEAAHIFEDWAGEYRRLRGDLRGREGLPGLLAYSDGIHVRVARLIRRTEYVPRYKLATNAHLTNGGLKSDPWFEENPRAPRDGSGRPLHLRENYRGGRSRPTMPMPLAVVTANRSGTHANATSSGAPITAQPGTPLGSRYTRPPTWRFRLDTGTDTRIAGRSIFDANRPLHRTRLVGCLDTTINGKSIYAEAETDRRPIPQSKLKDKVAMETAEDILAYFQAQLDDHGEVKEPFSAPSNPRDNYRSTLFDYVQSEPSAQELPQTVFGGQCRMIRCSEDILGRSTFGRHIRSEKELSNASIDPSATQPCSLLQTDRPSRTISRQELLEFINRQEDILAKATSNKNVHHAATNDLIEVEPDTHSGWVVNLEPETYSRSVEVQEPETQSCWVVDPERPSRITRHPEDISGKSASNSDSHQTPSKALVEPEPKQRARSMRFSTRSSAYPYPIHKRRGKELSGSTAVDTKCLHACLNCKHVFGTDLAESQARTRRFSCPEDASNSTTLGCGYPNCTRIFPAIVTKESAPLSRRLSSPEKAHGHEEARRGELLHAAERSTMVLRDAPTLDDVDSEEKYITIAVSEVTADTTDVTARRGRRHAICVTAEDSRHGLLDDEEMRLKTAITAAVSRHEADARHATQTLGSAARATRWMRVAPWHEVAIEEEANLEDILGEEPEHVTTTPPAYHGFKEMDRKLPPLDDDDHWPRLIAKPHSTEGTILDAATTPPTYHGFGKIDGTLPPLDDNAYWRNYR